MSKYSVVPVVRSQALLGEGPVWHQDRLYWVDIAGKAVHIYDPESEHDEVIQLDQEVGAVAPRQVGGLVAALENGFALLDLDTQEITMIVDPEEGDPRTQFNDGKCDPAGNFWAGTMGRKDEKGLGSLYMLRPHGTCERKIAGVSISNGICWDKDGTTMYYIDTPTQVVVAYDRDLSSGGIQNRRVVVEIDPHEGQPDGMTIDERGFLWIALWGGSAVVCYDPATGKRIDRVDLPVSLVTSCAFGGDDLQDFYITSARIGLREDEIAKEPLAGSLFRTRLGVKGVATSVYRG